MRLSRIFLFVLCLLVSLPLARGQETIFAPPQPSFTGERQLEVLRLELAEGSGDEAARRVELLLADHADDLTDHQGSIRTIRRWVMTLPDEERAKLAAAWEQQFGRSAQQALRQVISRTRDAGPEAIDELYAVYRRYPLSQAGQRARELAADRLARLGDTRGAAEIVGEASQGPPTVQVLFRPTWFARQSEAGPERRSIVVADAEHVFIADEAHVMKLRHAGLPMWLFDATTYYGSPQRPEVQTRDLKPALLVDAAGVAQMVVVRQPSADGKRYVLRALRASDGAPLWAFEPPGTRLSMLSNPSVAGRYVYAVAAEEAIDGRRVVVVALDVTDGRELWRRVVGRVLDQRDGGRGSQKPKALDTLWQEPADPVVDGQLLLINTHGGSVVALDRFDGQLGWASNYDQVDRSGRGRVNREDHKEALRRWSAEPASSGEGGIVAVAPRDTPAVIAIDRQTGQRLWSTGELDAASLVGVAGQRVIVAREGTYAFGATEGEKDWELHPRDKPGGRNEGPTVLVDGLVVMALRNQEVRAVNPADGSQAEVPAGRVVQLHGVLSNPEAVTRLREAGMLSALGVDEPKPQ